MEGQKCRWYKASDRKLPDRETLYEDGAERYTMREFFDQHQLNLPKIIIVTQGFEGDAELDTLSCGQVMRIHCVCKQKRGVAKDESGRTITIPLDYPLLFRPTKQKKKNVKGQRLGEILAENSLPVEVEFCCSEDVQLDVQALVRSFGKITVSSVYNESYCIANCIYKGVLFLHTILIPLYLKKVLVSTVTGIKGQNHKQFLQFQLDIETVATRIIYDAKYGNEIADIALYNNVDTDESKSNTVYENLEPDTFFRFAKEYSKLKFSQKKQILQSDDDFKTGETTHPMCCSHPEKCFSQHLPTKGYGTKNYSDRPLPLPPEPEQVKSFPERFPKPPEEKRRIDTLTVNEVGELLTALKLRRHVKFFTNEKIDGCLLVGLSETILREEFEFSEFEIIKLMKFIHTGHVPR